MELIFLEPVFKEKIWGGNKLREDFNMDVEGENIGEAWVISAHSNGISKVTSPECYKGMGLDELYKSHREIFANSKEETFPLLIKILDASSNLSVQVHPDDIYARENEGEGERGKTECWYIVSAEEGAEIVYGHTAKTKKELIDMIESGDFEHLLNRVKVKAGDFFFVPHGTIHAIGSGIVILETQQSSDTTYRVYDYDRRDEQGNTRELHLDKSIDVTEIPYVDPNKDIKLEKQGESKLQTLLECEFFDVYQYDVKNKMDLSLDDKYYLMTVIEGEGSALVDGKKYDLKQADSFIVPSLINKVEFVGNLKMIASCSNE